MTSPSNATSVARNSPAATTSHNTHAHTALVLSSWRSSSTASFHRTSSTTMKIINLLVKLCSRRLRLQATHLQAAAAPVPTLAARSTACHLQPRARRRSRREREKTLNRCSSTSFHLRFLLHSAIRGVLKDRGWATAMLRYDDYAIKDKRTFSGDLSGFDPTPSITIGTFRMEPTTNSKHHQKVTEPRCH